ncbi:hypothetical protein PBOI14_39300 [Pseudomonas sp. Boi14]|nr:hypothetical protein PBOI14_39300 [Pseudomonas sp. Boi14]
MRNYLSAIKEFDYQHTMESALAGSLSALNACVECCDRHALPGRIALFWEGRDGSSASYTFTELQDKAGRLANFFLAQGSARATRSPGCCHAMSNS